MSDTVVVDDSALAELRRALAAAQEKLSAAGWAAIGSPLAENAFGVVHAKLTVALGAVCLAHGGASVGLGQYVGNTAQTVTEAQEQLDAADTESEHMFFPRKSGPR